MAFHKARLSHSSSMCWRQRRSTSFLATHTGMDTLITPPCFLLETRSAKPPQKVMLHLRQWRNRDERGGFAFDAKKTEVIHCATQRQMSTRPVKHQDKIVQPKSAMVVLAPGSTHASTLPSISVSGHRKLNVLIRYQPMAAAYYAKLRTDW